MEDSIDVDKPSTDKEATVDVAEDKDDSDNEQSVIEDNDELVNADADIDKEDDSRSLDQEQLEDGGDRIEHRSNISLDLNERESAGEDEAKDQQEDDFKETGEKTSIDQEHVQSTTPQDRRQRYCRIPVRELSPYINLHILLTVVHICSMELVWRNCFKVRTFYLW